MAPPPSVPSLQRSRVVDTHVSTLVFLDDRVYKRKRPVCLDFVDLRDRRERERICHREVELNSRLAPDVYLGVADLVGPGDGPFDHFVVMRRLPEHRRLSRLVADGEGSVLQELRRIARIMAAFHVGAERGPRIDRAATAAAVRANWDANFAVLRAFVPELVGQEELGHLENLVERYISGREPMFASRIAAGMACDGHGDLLADDIFCLDDGPRILDCVEFDDRLRWGDVLADIAFLAMDLERLGRPDLAAYFAQAYVEFSGHPHPRSLMHHYIAYRAQVRAKIACLRHRQGARGEAADARRLLDITFRNLEKGRVVLALVGGPPASGKSTLATSVANALDWIELGSDDVRKDVAGVGRGRPAPARYGEGVYSPGMTARTYARLLDRAALLLERGESVVLDATWNVAAYRERAAALAARCRADLVEIVCHASPSTVAERLRARDRRPSGISDAGTGVAGRIAVGADPWPTATTIATDDDLASSLSNALHCIADASRAGTLSACSRSPRPTPSSEPDATAHSRTRHPL